MNNTNTSPTSSTARIQQLDIFRGFAIFGIFMVNILVMNVSFAYRGEWEAEQTGTMQRVSFFVLETFFYSKFFAIFSLLFGVGVALQIERSKKTGAYRTSFFLRRFGSLFLFGVAHILFLWSGDILHLYGMLGIVLLLFFQFSPKVILWSAILVFLFPFYSLIYEACMNWISFDYRAALAELTRKEILELKLHGGYFSGIFLRLKEYAFASSLIYAGIAPVALSMMLFGGYLVKKGVFQNINFWVDRAKTYLLVTLGILLIFRFTLLYFVLPSFEIPFGSPLSILLLTVFQLSDIALSISYLWIIAYLFRRAIFQKIFHPLSYVGRTAFSNYILQSLLGYWIMRSFKMYETFTPFECIILVICIFIFQIILSKTWLKYYRYGPLEWCWRCISYWRILPIKLQS